MIWKFGTQIVQYETWGGEIGTARPVTVVEDSPDRIALFTHPGTPLVTRGIENRRTLDLSERIELYMRALDPEFGDFRRTTSPDRHVLALYGAQSWHSILLFWTIDWRFEFWYVNFHTPMRRLRQGVAFQDCALDIVVQPDMTWTWKDADEFEQLITKGFFSREEGSAVRIEADRMVRTIEGRGTPFCDGWEDWRPDGDWPTPRLPEDWMQAV